METTKKTQKKAKPSVTAGSISQSYKEYVLNHGHPSSVFIFCKEIGISESTFYEHFGSFEGVERSIWLDYISKTKAGLESDQSFEGFTSREKILAFYYGLAEVLKNDRSFVLYQLKGREKQFKIPTFLKGFKNAFDEWIKSVIVSGVVTGEIARRPQLDERYHILFWAHLMFILQFWLNDDSANFENTDAAIEKSVNLAFDLIGKGVLDNAIDFGKFLFQTAKN